MDGFCLTDVNLNICVFHHVVYNRSIFMYQKPSYTTMFAKSNK